MLFFTICFWVKTSWPCNLYFSWELVGNLVIVVFFAREDQRGSRPSCTYTWVRTTRGWWGLLLLRVYSMVLFSFPESSWRWIGQLTLFPDWGSFCQENATLRFSWTCGHWYFLQIFPQRKSLFSSSSSSPSSRHGKNRQPPASTDRN